MRSTSSGRRKSRELEGQRKSGAFTGARHRFRKPMKSTMVKKIKKVSRNRTANRQQFRLTMYGVVKIFDPPKLSRYMSRKFEFDAFCATGEG